MNYHVASPWGEDVLCDAHALLLFQYEDWIVCTDPCDRCYECARIANPEPAFVPEPHNPKACVTYWEAGHEVCLEDLPF